MKLSQEAEADSNGSTMAVAAMGEDYKWSSCEVKGCWSRRDSGGFVSVVVRACALHLLLANPLQDETVRHFVSRGFPNQGKS